jgi:hypothetical protein
MMDEEKSESRPKMTDKEVVDYIMQSRDEADSAKVSRMGMNKENYDMFHLKHDFSHKEEGQSQEILSKQSMAVEQNKSFFQQALASFGEWWRAEAAFADADTTLLVRPEEITKLTNHFLQEARYYSHVGNSVEQGMLASLVISKTSGCMEPKPKFVSKKRGRGKGLKRWVEKIDDKSWKLKFSQVRAENFYPDPKEESGLYEIEDAWVDHYKVVEMAEYDEDFESDMVKRLSRFGQPASEQEGKEARETGQDITQSGHRPKVKLTEFWGTILNREGEVCYENVQAIVANDTDLILKPRPNPLWHQRSPYTRSPLMEVANSVWHKAPMDAPTMHNQALIEMYNLMVDAAMKQVHAVSQLRKDWLDNPAQVSEGIDPGSALVVNSLCPPGGKVLEPLTTVQIPSEAFNIYALMNQEFDSSAMSNNLREGINSSTTPSATAIVQQSQTINGVFTGMAKNFESRQIQKELELAWMTTAQNWADIDREIFVSLFGSQRGGELADLSPEDVFANTVNGVRFRVFGITLTLAKTQDFQKLTTLLQTIAASPPLLEAYVAKYDIGKTLGEIMTALNIDKMKLEIPQAVQNTMMQPEDQGQPETMPDQMSQVAPPPDQGSMEQMMGAEMDNPAFAPAPGGGM